MRKIRVLSVTDLHQRGSLLDQLKEAVRKHSPVDVVVCVGDFLDAGPPDETVVSVEATAERLASLECDAVAFARGNHEDWQWPAFEAAWQQTKRPLLALHGTHFTFGPLVIIGFPCFMGSDEFYAENRPLPIYSPDEWLDTLLVRLGPAGCTLWLMHEPPSLDIGAFGAYEPEWEAAVSQKQPIITISGHVHEPSAWRTWIGESVCCNCGQETGASGRLHYAIVDFEFPNDTPCLPTRFNIQKFPSSDLEHN